MSNGEENTQRAPRHPLAEVQNPAALVNEVYIEGNESTVKFVFGERIANSIVPRAVVAMGVSDFFRHVLAINQVNHQYRVAATKEKPNAPQA